MYSTRKIIILERTSILLVFLACIPITFIYMFLRDISMLNSLFIGYVNSGSSLFLPFLPSSIIVFQFSTGHLIDIIIIINIITFIQRSAYQYYVKICLKRNYFEIYSDPYLSESEETQEGSFLNSNLIMGLKDDSGTTINKNSVEFNIYQKNRISSIHKMKRDNTTYLYKSSNKNNRHKIFLFIFQKFSTNTLINYHLPSKNNNIFSNSNENIQQEEGR